MLRTAVITSSAYHQNDYLQITEVSFGEINGKWQAMRLHIAEPTIEPNRTDDHTCPSVVFCRKSTRYLLLVSSRQ